jgi:glycosyltransferase involved in cell wall biosynthesis
MRLLFLTHYFPPEVGAPQSRIDELARILADKGHRVTVLTNFPHYPAGIVSPPYRGKLIQREHRGEVKVIRSYVWARPNRGFASRLANHLSFCLSSIIAAAGLARVDVVVTESPPLFLGFSGWLISRMLGAKLVFNVADVWPQSAVEMGALTNRKAIAMAEWLERFIYDRSHRVTVVTEGIRRDLLERGLPPERVVTLTNGVDLVFFRVRGLGAAIKSELGLSGKFVVMYAGTHGMAQGLETALKAASLLAGVPGIVFVMAGDGAEKAGLVEKAGRMRLGNVRFLEAWPKRRMPELLEAADACLVSLKKLPVFKRAMPSKMYEAMALERPLLASIEGLAAETIAKSGCGLVAAPEDPAALAEAAKRLYGCRKAAIRMGRRGRRYVEKNFSRAVIAGRWERLLREAAAERSQHGEYGQ